MYRDIISPSADSVKVSLNYFSPNENRRKMYKKLKKASTSIDEKKEVNKKISHRDLKLFSPIPDNKMQRKIDYFITPYNKTLHYDKHMRFDEKAQHLNRSIDFSDSSNHEWTRLMNFVINEEKNIFRHSLVSINNGLYLEINNMISDEAQRRKKVKTECRNEDSIQLPDAHKRCSSQMANEHSTITPDFDFFKMRPSKMNKQRKTRFNASQMEERSRVHGYLENLSSEHFNLLLSKIMKAKGNKRLSKNGSLDRENSFNLANLIGDLVRGNAFWFIINHILIVKQHFHSAPVVIWFISYI